MSCTGDVQLVAPVTAVMPKSDVLQLLPRLLELQPQQLRLLYRRLTTALGDMPPHFTASELLLALHVIDPKKSGVPLRRIIAAIDTALHSPESFPQSTVAQVH